MVARQRENSPAHLLSPATPDKGTVKPVTRELLPAPVLPPAGLIITLSRVLKGVEPSLQHVWQENNHLSTYLLTTIPCLFLTCFISSSLPYFHILQVFLYHPPPFNVLQAVVSDSIIRINFNRYLLSMI